MASSKSSGEGYKIGFYAFLALFIIAGFLLFNAYAQQSANQKNKEVAMQFIGQAVETEEISEFADKNFDENIVLEFPPGFNAVQNKNIVTGKENAKNMIKLWQSYTNQKVNVLDITAENNLVIMLVSQDRIFEGNTGVAAHKSNPMAYFIYFQNGKIIKVVSVFDVLGEVESFKDAKYP